MRRLNLDEGEIRSAGVHLLRLLQDIERSSSEQRVVPRLDRAALSNLVSEPFPDQSIGIDRRSMRSRHLATSSTGEIWRCRTHSLQSARR